MQVFERTAYSSLRRLGFGDGTVRLTICVFRLNISEASLLRGARSANGGRFFSLVLRLCLWSRSFIYPVYP
jgi:hypothetical protein